MSARFACKSVLVTGAASGIGLAAADLFATEGAHVLAVGLSDELEQAFRGDDGITVLCGDAGSEAYSASEAGVVSARRHSDERTI